jgi:K(+)-stimulated pyrophosphate-energized sodium pump
VALISFILLAVPSQTVQVQLIVWIFAMRIMMIIASGLSYLINESIQAGRHAKAAKMDFEAPLTFLVWLTSVVSVVITYVVSYLLVGDLGDGTLWWKLSSIITAGTLAGAIIPEVVKVFTSTNLGTRGKRRCRRRGEAGRRSTCWPGSSPGNFSAFWMGLVITSLMGIAYLVSLTGLGAPLPGSTTPMMLAPAVFAFGLVAFGFLGMGPVTIAVDSYGPVTDNAQSVYELSLIETIPNIKSEVKRDFGFDLDFERAKEFLEETDGAGNTFKATAHPVLIGTAVVGATTKII